ncbi:MULTISPECIES: amidohydrolase [Brachybacterium]|uniref:Hydrolase n=2 Tax=Brachybacterium TaxID=43668 RepID=A0A426SR15_9MICO|nr:MULTISPECIES: amidohydrolase family protein [Brachybacterium]RRR20500.1 hydrolase [Brachybacterium paraconglomeratum]GLI32402.1 hydrolase [Brachybacterium conglomeratum]GLK03935.1 hydrolase [Brachybacterium conglomeratum]
MLIRQVRPFDAATGGAPDAPVDLRIRDGVIAELAAGLSPAPGEEVLDGGGALAIPGLWDQHVHSGQLAQAHARLDTSGAGSVGVILELVRAELASRRETAVDPVQALIGFGHRLVDFAVQPTVPMLDEATGSVPTVLIGGDAHHAWMNSAALRALGLPPRDGIVAEEEWFVLAPRLPELPGVADAVATGSAMMQRQALQRGVVGLVDMEWGRPWEVWPQRSPRMRIRTAVYPEELAAAPGPTGTPLEERGLVTMGPLKVIVDGALGSHSAYTRETYTDGHGYAGRGVLSVGPEALRDALVRARAQGLTAAVHAIGDAAAQVALAAIRAVGLGARIEHAQMLTDDDIAAMAALGVTASVQPAHLLDDRDATEAVWPGHGGQAFRLRDLLTAGVPLALGSDAPVAPLDPWLAMAAAVHRSADERPGWHPEQQLQPREALAASTDGITSLRPGGVGDVVLLEGDPFADVPLGADGLMVEAAAREAAERLRETHVLETVVAGVPSIGR